MRSLRAVGRARGIQILLTVAVALGLAFVVADAFGLRAGEPVTVTGGPSSTPATTEVTLPAPVPTVVITTAPPAATTTAPDVTAPPPAPASPALEEIEVPIVLVDPSGALVERSRTVVEATAPVATVNALLVGPSETERAEGLDTAIPAGVALIDMRLAETGVMTVDLSASFAERLTSSAAPVAVGQVVCTVDGFTGVDAVRLLVNGEQRDDLRGVAVDQPLTCDGVRTALVG